MSARLPVCMLAVLAIVSQFSTKPVVAQQAPPPIRVWQSPSVLVRGGRMDARQPVFRARYGAQDSVARSLSMTGSDDEVLTRAKSAAGLGTTGGSFRKESDVLIDGVRHVRWRQMMGGFPVMDRSLSIAVDGHGNLSFLLNSADPASGADVLFALPVVVESQVREAALGAIAGGVRVGEPSLLVLPEERPRLVWQTFVWTEDPPAEWRVLVDAATGQVVGARDETVTKRGSSRRLPVPMIGSTALGRSGGPVHADTNRILGYPHSGQTGDALPGQGATTFERDPSLNPAENGSGMVFDPDPLATSGAFYGPPYVDADDADSPELRAQRRLVTLQEITRGGDGLYRLQGPFVKIVGTNMIGQTVYAPPAEATPTGFVYNRSQGGFEAVNAYYHMDTSQRYVQQLGFSDVAVANPVQVNPAGTIADDSGWVAGLNYIFFGIGGVDDAEDAFVVLHEYGHALLESGAPGLRNTLEGMALHEGWSDYWAASYERSLVEDGTILRTDWERAFRWDSGDGLLWITGRDLTNTGHYPESTCSDDASSGSGCNEYRDAPLWSTSLMEIYGELGRTLSDRLNLLSHRYLSTPVTFRDAAAALVQADVDHYGGAHLPILVEKLGARGLVDVEDYGPLASHQALTATEALGSSRTVEVRATGASAPISTVTLFYRYDQGDEASITLSKVGTDLFRGQLPLPESPARVSYWIRVLDTQVRAAVLPAGAPTDTFSFLVGPDTTPPVITHEPIPNTGLADWPVEVVATIEDDLGVAQAVVEYEIRNDEGDLVTQGVFPLEADGSTFVGRFDVALSLIRTGTVVEYRIRATDKAIAANERYVPASGYHVFTVFGVGVLRSFSASNPSPDILLDGDWDVGLSRSGIVATPSGGPVWGIGLEAPYSATARLSRLTLPTMDLTGIDQAWLVFRQWFDTEHDGRAEPGTDAGDALYDGGNVKISVDGGDSWSLGVPLAGYSGTIRTGGSNPLEGEPAFGGYSYGWRMVAVPLPTESDIRVAFDFGADGSDTGDSQGSFGWRVDGLNITTLLPDDVGPPTVLDTSTAPSVLSVAAAARPYVSVRAVDDVGVTDAFATYDIVRSTGRSTGVLRLAVSSTDLTVFEGRIDPGTPVEAGDRLELRYLLRDFEGNESVFPPTGTNPLRIDVRFVTETDLLAGARSDGSWIREQDSWSLPGTPGGLVSLPVALASNNETIELRMSHTYRFGPDAGATVVISTDDGRTWSEIAPVDGYPRVREGRGVWAGNAPFLEAERFDLSPWKGSVVMIRFETVGDVSEVSDEWALADARLVQRSKTNELELPTDPALHANFPDPAWGMTNISFSMPESGKVRIEVFDPLGRRIALLTDDVYLSGTHSANWDVSAVSAGVYYIRMTAGGKVFMEPAVVAR